MRLIYFWAWWIERFFVLGYDLGPWIPPEELD
jgi:hypothetical protein